MTTPGSYLRALKRELEPYLEAMRRTWGFAPQVKVTAQAEVRIRVYVKTPHPLRRIARAALPLFKGMCIDTFFINAATGESTQKHRALAEHLFARFDARATDFSTDGFGVTAPDRLLEPCFGFYGERAIRLVAEPLIHVKVDYNIKDFAHKGGGALVYPRSLRTYRRPARVARLIVREVVSHRNSCQECGVGIAPIGVRAHGWYARDGLRSDVPPDAVEEMVTPRLAKKLKQRLRS